MPMTNRRTLLTAASLMALAIPALAQGFPERPVRIVVPFGPGGGTDNLVRILEPHLRASLGQPVVIENRAGAGGTIGADLVARGPADGYSVVVVDSSFAINPSLFPQLPYDSARDFTPVSLLATGPVILLAHPGAPMRTLQELVTQAKAQPGRFSYASGGNGASTHLAGELLKLVAGIDLVHVPYRGTGPATTDVVAGHVPLMFNGISAARPHVDSGRLRALAVTGTQRAAALPDVPTFAEAGLPDVTASTYWGTLAPAGVPAPIVARLSEAFRFAVTHPDVQERLRSLGFNPIGGPAEAYAENLRTETTKWAEVVRRAGVKLD
ncbi:Bug family tripartite tricarboxylate transporter substrate binding protein [Falsiroseomonas sp. E2-1-a4]|uniref:Bug family tripartite tricarboxylate transporter substrate binding protein n=1 Tax=Falsiroseomonas sp. E2-1-a4 TaxID=3239299 RepID=UPI003F30ED06